MEAAIPHDSAISEQYQQVQEVLDQAAAAVPDTPPTPPAAESAPAPAPEPPAPPRPPQTAPKPDQYHSENVSVTQEQPSNVNVSIRINSPGDDGPVVQINNAGGTTEVEQVVQQRSRRAGARRARRRRSARHVGVGLDVGLLRRRPARGRCGCTPAGLELALVVRPRGRRRRRQPGLRARGRTRPRHARRGRADRRRCADLRRRAAHDGGRSRASARAPRPATRSPAQLGRRRGRRRSASCSRGRHASCRSVARLGSRPTRGCRPRASRCARRAACARRRRLGLDLAAGRRGPRARRRDGARHGGLAPARHLDGGARHRLRDRPTSTPPPPVVRPHLVVDAAALHPPGAAWVARGDVPQKPRHRAELSPGGIARYQRRKQS